MTYANLMDAINFSLGTTGRQEKIDDVTFELITDGTTVAWVALTFDAKGTVADKDYIAEEYAREAGLWPLPVPAVDDENPF